MVAAGTGSKGATPGDCSGVVVKLHMTARDASSVILRLHFLERIVKIWSAYAKGREGLIKGDGRTCAACTTNHGIPEEYLIKFSHREPLFQLNKKSTIKTALGNKEFEENGIGWISYNAWSNEEK
ncbi:hypothetical protein MKZ38_000017 [Zalerion maritima]|uniref:Uncharacterized protein n=1 Tax=Zalerion maritima TaxID=339359 RepID=A0AAD5RG05_9PEZI|nr:hypothetical protein MKZ38_000017 [Zalerion maritima]